MLFVPGDRPDRMEKALASGADALILDLEDSVAPVRKSMAREAVSAFLVAPRATSVQVLVRINPLDGAFAEDDLQLLSAMPAGARPDAVMLPKAEGAASIRALTERLPGCPPILPIAAETPAALFTLGSYADETAHLAGLAWGAEDLSSALGASGSRDGSGLLRPPVETARALVLFAAHAAGVAAIETVYPDVHDTDGLAACAARAAGDGFTGMLAIHPAQIAAINAAFTPTEAQIAHARAVVHAFARDPEAGVLQIEGKMVDAPHLRQAQLLLRRINE